MLLFARGAFATLGILLLHELQYVDKLKMCENLMTFVAIRKSTNKPTVWISLLRWALQSKRRSNVINSKLQSHVRRVFPERTFNVFGETLADLTRAKYLPSKLELQVTPSSKSSPLGSRKESSISHLIPWLQY